MRVLYIDKYFFKNRNDIVFTGVSLPVLERKKIKNELKEIIDNNFSFDLVNYVNVNKYFNICQQFMKNNQLNSFSIKTKKYKRSKYCNILFSIILKEYQANKEPLRVYIPFDKNKNFLKTINKMIIKRKLNITVEEIKYEESILSQLANVIAGCIHYHSHENLYFKNLGKKGKPQLIAYIYSCKKSKNKIEISDFLY